MFLRHGAEQDRRLRAHAERAGHGERRADRVPLVRQRRRSSAPAVGRLGDLADLGLCEQLDVAGDLLERARGDRQRGSISATRAREACQGRSGASSSSRSARRSATASPPVPSAASVPAAPPSSAASGSAASRSRASRTARSQPAALKPNVVGSACWSSVRAGIRVPLCSSASRAHAPRHRLELAVDRRPGPPRDEHRGGVHHVLARSSPVHIVGGVAADRGLERSDQRRRRVRGRAAVPSELRRVEALRVARGSDGGGRLPGDDAQLGLGGSERRLELEHGLDPGAARDGLPHGVGHEQLVKHRRKASRARPGGGRRSAAPRRPRARRADRADPGPPARAPGPTRSPRPRRGSRSG